MVDYGLFFLNEENGYTQEEVIKLAELGRKQIKQTVKDVYGIDNVSYDIKTEKVPTEKGKARYQSLKIVTQVPNVINNGQNLENILTKMDGVAPVVESEKLVDDAEKSHYIVFNGIGFLGGAFYQKDTEQMNYIVKEGLKLGFKEKLQYGKPASVKKRKVLSYQPASPKGA